jgi:hypothetical protein
MLIFISNLALLKSAYRSCCGVRRLPRCEYTRNLPHQAGEYLGRNIGPNRRAACGPLEASLQPSSTKTVGPLLVYPHPPYSSWAAHDKSATTGHALVPTTPALRSAKDKFLPCSCHGDSTRTSRHVGGGMRSAMGRFSMGMGRPHWGL